jgi:V/A-type H+-transporting ATPase subunit C
LVRTKIDLVNVSIAVRILRMQNGDAGKALLEEALLDGGTVARKTLLSWFSEGESALLANLAGTQYTRLADAILAGDGSSATLDRVADDFWMSMIAETKFIPVGLEVMVSFLLAHEYEVKNLRIVLAGKEAGVPVSTIRERIRESYV